MDSTLALEIDYTKEKLAVAIEYLFGVYAEIANEDYVIIPLRKYIDDHDENDENIREIYKNWILPRITHKLPIIYTDSVKEPTQIVKTEQHQEMYQSTRNPQAQSVNNKNISISNTESLGNRSGRITNVYIPKPNTDPNYVHTPYTVALGADGEQDFLTITVHY